MFHGASTDNMREFAKAILRNSRHHLNHVFESSFVLQTETVEEPIEEDEEATEKPEVDEDEGKLDEYL